MKVRVIPDIDSCLSKACADDGCALIEQSTYDEYKARAKALLDQFHGKNAVFQLNACSLVFTEDWKIKIVLSDHASAESEAQWTEYFMGECGVVAFISKEKQS